MKRSCSASFVSAIVDHQRLRRAAVDGVAHLVVQLVGGVVVDDPRHPGVVDLEHLGRDALAQAIPATAVWMTMGFMTR